MIFFKMSVAAGIITLIVVILRRIFLYRLPKMTFVFLWGVVLLRYLVPVSILPSSNIYREYSVSNVIIESFTHINESILSAHGGNTGQSAPFTAGAGQGFTAVPITVIWYIGMLMVFIFFTVVYVKNYILLRRSMVKLNNRFISDWLAENKTRRPFAVFVSDKVAVPIVFGFLKPNILLPVSLDMENKDHVRYILTHEHTHIKRCDLLWKLFSAIIVCLHWFNPMAWLIFTLLNRDLELACDEAVINRLGEEIKANYAHALVSIAENKRKRIILNHGFNINVARERIVSIMKYKKSTITTLIMAILLVVGTATVSASSPVITSGNARSVEADDIKVHFADECCGQDHDFADLLYHPLPEEALLVGENTYLTNARIYTVTADEYVYGLDPVADKLVIDSIANGLMTFNLSTSTLEYWNDGYPDSENHAFVSSCSPGRHLEVAVTQRRQHVNHLPAILHPGLCTLVTSTNWLCYACLTTGVETQSLQFLCPNINFQPY